MPFTRPTLNQLNDRIQADIDSWLPGADSRLRRSVLGVLGRVLAGAMHGLYGLLEWTWRQIFPDTAEGAQLARWAAIWGITRKSASSATGTVRFTGANGSVIALGTGLVRADGADYETLGAVTIAGGFADAIITAIEPGPDGNAVAGQRLSMVSPIVGVDAQATVQAGDLIGGHAEEADADLRGRLIDRIQRPPHGGNAADYKSWALEVPGVTRAWVYRHELGVGTVTVRFVMDARADIIPEAGDVAAVQAHIELVRPVTADVTVVAPIPFDIDFEVRAVPNDAAVEAAIVAELTDLLYREGAPGGTLLISHLREAISVAAGETDHVLLSPTANINLATGRLPVLGEVTFVP